ncbi:preprotein translocase [Candidatus Saccharibacteria bacterium]|nr:MAG: preprotein translocase [Candidatus Saccharibacteria bacterium]
MKLIDAHCHIHQSEFFGDEREAVYDRARASDVAMICASTSVQASREALDFCAAHEGCYALVGIHPHDAAREDIAAIGELLRADNSGAKIIYGIGEIGLDYYYEHSPRADQIAALEQQLQWASDYDLPVSFHVRDEKTLRGVVWDDFWPVFDNFHGLRGVLHSFTDGRRQLERGFERGLYVGINGISTFTKDSEQQRLYASLPLEKIVLETDAPYLTPAPLRGRMNEPSFVGRVAEHAAAVRGLSFGAVADATTANAKQLFHLE